VQQRVPIASEPFCERAGAGACVQSVEQAVAGAESAADVDLGAGLSADDADARASFLQGLLPQETIPAYLREVAQEELEAADARQWSQHAEELQDDMLAAQEEEDAAAARSAHLPVQEADAAAAQEAVRDAAVKAMCDAEHTAARQASQEAEAEAARQAEAAAHASGALQQVTNGAPSSTLTGMRTAAAGVPERNTASCAARDVPVEAVAEVVVGACRATCMGFMHEPCNVPRRDVHPARCPMQQPSLHALGR
jgi:hypothetical protein